MSEHPIARREALLLGAKHGPGVALALAPREAVVTLGRRASGLVRPPVLTVGGGYRAGALTPGAELNVSLAQEVPLAGVGGARSEFAKSFAHSVDTDAKRARLEAASRAALAWIDALLARELLRLREEGQTEANAILKITASRVEAGVAPPHELSLARGEAAAAQAGVLDAEGLQVEALAELRFAIGVEPTAAVTAAGDLYGADERTVDDESAVRAALAQNPSILLAVARAEQARGETRLSAAMWGPSLNVGATYVREGSGDRVFLGFVGIPIPLFDAAGFETSRQRAAQLTAESQVELTRAEIARDIRLALHDRQHWREVRDALQHGALAAYGEAFRSAQTQYEVGTSEIGPVILARQRLLGARERLAEVAARVQRADLAVARATGALIEEAKP
ncbi:MAG TPA: TolC family protein [Polyangiaceae bacterium]|nr:TolC family protein [Polyangiaceae bacterium]